MVGVVFFVVVLLFGECRLVLLRLLSADDFECVSSWAHNCSNFSSQPDDAAEEDASASSTANDDDEC